jgi:hypothetical protein
MTGLLLSSGDYGIGYVLYTYSRVMRSECPHHPHSTLYNHVSRCCARKKNKIKINGEKKNKQVRGWRKSVGTSRVKSKTTTTNRVSCLPLSFTSGTTLSCGRPPSQRTRPLIITIINQSPSATRSIHCSSSFFPSPVAHLPSCWQHPRPRPFTLPLDPPSLSSTPA